MPILEYFLADAAAETLGAEAIGSTLGADALAATALTAGEVAGLGAAGEGALATAPGINQAAMATDAMTGGAGAGNAGINASQVAAQQNAAAQIANSGLPPGFDQQLQNVQNLSQGPAVQVASTNPTAGLESLNQPVSNGGITSVPQAGSQLPMGIDMPGTYMPPSNALYTPPASVYTAPEPSALMKGLDSATAWAKQNPFPAMAGAYMGANALGLLNPSGATFNNAPYTGPLSKYRLSDDFRAGSANPQDFQYTPRRYAAGGIMGSDPYTIPVGYEEGGQMPETQNYAKGGSLSESIESYQKFLSGKPMEAPAVSRDVGIYYDQDPDTRYQDALTAAQIRQAKVNQRAYVSPPAAKRPTPMGQLQMASVKPRKQGDAGGGDVEAAQGGIMQSYADGGITGDGNLNLQIPLNLGGGSGGGAGSGFGGYTPAGGGNVNPNNGAGSFSGSTPAGPNPFGGIMQGIAGLLNKNGYDPQAVAANPQGFMDQMRQMDEPYGGINGRSMDMFSRGPNPFMDERASSQNYQNVINGRGNMMVGNLGNQYMAYAQGGIAGSSLGGYAAGGNPRLLKGPGDGMSDNIPATINGRQPARLADGEFVVPADVVSHLGNGSTEAGAKQLHAMMDKVRSARTGNSKQGKQIKPQKYMPK
jgi:hypothetical protein